MDKIAVVGAGTMGNGIAHVFALNGAQVSLIDISEKVLEAAISTIGKNLDRMVAKGTIDEKARNETLKRVRTGTNLQDGVRECGLVVEAASERIDLKKKIFSDIDKYAPLESILASNTSSISITDIGSATDRPDRIIGMHFMNPVPIMKLVEVIRGYDTSDQTTRTVLDLSKKLGKVPVEVRDYPGFISNRILMPMINEAIYALYEGVAGVEEIDTVMKLGMAHPMGPLKLADFIGLDVCRSILVVLYEGFGNFKYAPCPLLNRMVAAGKLGVKSGEGFYRYKPGSKDAAVAPQFV